MEDYSSLVVDIASQLAWIIAVFKEPPEEGLSFTKAKIGNASSTNDVAPNDKSQQLIFRLEHEQASGQTREGDSIPWHKLFDGLKVASGFLIPSRLQGIRDGVELPLSILSSFSGVRYPVQYKNGFVLKGRVYALFPITVLPR